MQVSVQLDEKGKNILAMYFRLNRHRVARTVEYTDSVLIDLDSKGDVIGVEVLCPESVSALLDIADMYDVPELRKKIDPKLLVKALTE